MSLKEVKQRIASVRSTQKITAAMKLVSAAKLRKAQSAVENMLPYQNTLNRILSEFLSCDSHFETPFTEVREVSRVAIFVVSSNGSLCGGFNANIIRHLKAILEEYRGLGKENVLLYPVGRKVTETLKKMNISVQQDLSTLANKPTYKEASELARSFMKLFSDKQVDRVELVYNHFKSTSTQLFTRKNLLPIDLQEDKKESDLLANFIVEPSVEAVMNNLLPKVICLNLFTALLDSNAAEQAARMVAMQVATDNADELITDLTREYNKGRQQAITNELLDIASGSAT